MIQTLFGSVEQEPSLLERLKSGVQKTRAGLVTRLEDMLQGAKQIVRTIPVRIFTMELAGGRNIGVKRHMTP